MLRITPLASGSSANATLVQGTETTILIDAGLSARAIASRLIECGTSLAALDALLLTHEHVDHVKGLGTLFKKSSIPLFATPGTLMAVGAPCDAKRLRAQRPVRIGEFLVHPIEVSHDAVDPVGFLIENHAGCYAHFSDLGTVDAAVLDAAASAHILLLEANHDPELLWSCRYPAILKERIASRQGHLSNRECAETLAHPRLAAVEQVFLAHLSQESNTPAKALETVRACVPAERFAALRCAERSSSSPSAVRGLQPQAQVQFPFLNAGVLRSAL